MKKIISMAALVFMMVLLISGCTKADEVQNVTSIVGEHSYPEITVKKGIPVKWTLQVDAGVLNNCNKEIIIPDLNITKELQEGENIIEFTPAESGVIPYSCWMDMIQSQIIVED